MDSSVWNDIKPFITPTTDVYGPDGLLQILEDRFKLFYPLYNRRLDFFQASSTSGETASSYLSRLQTLAVEADLELLTRDDIISLFFLATYPDDEIRKMTTQLPDASLEEVRRIADKRSQHLRQYTGTRALMPPYPLAGTQPALPATPAQPAIAAVHPVADPDVNALIPVVESIVAAVLAKNPGGQRQARRPSKQQSRQQQSPQQGNLLDTSRCNRCSSDRHRSSECPALLQNLSCLRCGRVGHLSRACHASQPSSGPQQPSNNRNGININALQFEEDYGDLGPQPTTVSNRTNTSRFSVSGTTRGNTPFANPHRHAVWQVHLLVLSRYWKWGLRNVVRLGHAPRVGRLPPT